MISHCPANCGEIQGADMPSDPDSTDIDGALGTLINLSGKMRMLSHRAALFAMLVGQGKAGTPGQLASYDSAVEEFRAIYKAVREGNRDLDIPPEAARELGEDGALDEAITAPIDAFVRHAADLRPALAGGTRAPEPIEKLVDLVAGDLLNALNRLTAAVSARLNTRMAARQSSTIEARAAMLKAVGSITDVSMKVKLISINAGIEAARAGPYGKSFGVIASEIRALSEDAARSAQGLRDQMEHSP